MNKLDTALTALALLLWSPWIAGAAILVKSLYSNPTDSHRRYTSSPPVSATRGHTAPGSTPPSRELSGRLPPPTAPGWMPGTPRSLR